MRKLTAMTLGLVAVLAWAPAWGQQDQKVMEEQYQAVAAARTRAELAARKTGEAFDENRNGWREAAVNLDRSIQKIQQTYQRAIQAEQAKAEDLRNAATIEDFNQRMQAANEEWQAVVKERQGIDARYREGYNIAQNATQVYGGLVNMERPWKDAKMDLTVLQNNFDQAAKVIDGGLQQMQKAVADLQQKDKDWQAKLAGAVAATGGK